MLLPDVNILVYAYIRESRDHERFRDWMKDLVSGEEPFAMSHLVCSGFLRLVTNSAIYSPPTLVEDALTFLEKILRSPGCEIVAPGSRHWWIFDDLCRATRARGNLVPDAYFAALAIESGNDWVTMDRGFARFPGLRWRRPF